MGKSVQDSDWNRRGQGKVKGGSPRAFPINLLSVLFERGVWGLRGMLYQQGRTPGFCSEFLWAADAGVGALCLCRMYHSPLLRISNMTSWPLCLVK